VPTYAYRCSVCGPFELVRPMAQAAAESECPECDRSARRVWEAPALRGVDPTLRRALDAEVRSAHEPAVVGTPPPRAADRRRGRATRYTTDPRHQRLPRPGAS
jgi:putative FmdB family regulatory protein